MDNEGLKNSGISIHVIATGAGAGIQQKLWETPGCSAYLSGASFPYAPEETEELLGFKPDQFVSKETAIDLASAAYMKAFRFGGKKAVGVGVTASVASSREHRGDHRFHMCVITEDQVRVGYQLLDKGVGDEPRQYDGNIVDTYVKTMLTLVATKESGWGLYSDETDLAKKRFFERPFFTANGKRLAELPEYAEAHYALMPGSFNPPHEGHFGVANSFRDKYSKNVIFEIGTNPPHKNPPTVQELLQRAKMLKGYDTLFTKDIALYLQKARAYPGMALLMGADTMQRILDPKWGVNVPGMLKEFRALHTKLYVGGRMIDGKWTTVHDVIQQYSKNDPNFDLNLFRELDGRWDVSSSELRQKK